MPADKPSFLSYRVTDIKRRGKKGFYEPGDYVVDKHGIIGQINFESGFGNYVTFIDDYSVYDSIVDLGLKKTVFTSPNIYDAYKRQFKDVTKMARVIAKSLDENYSYIGLFNNGTDLYVRASNRQNLTTGFTNQGITSNTDFISIRLSPFWNFDLDQFSIKKSLRKSSNPYTILRDLFIDIDLGLDGLARRFKYVISDDLPYNEELWQRIDKQFKKYNFQFRK